METTNLHVALPLRWATNGAVMSSGIRNLQEAKRLAINCAKGLAIGADKLKLELPILGSASESFDAELLTKSTEAYQFYFDQLPIARPRRSARIASAPG